MRDFVRQVTAVSAPSLVPELRLRLASEPIAPWAATEEHTGAVQPPPFWAHAWPGGLALARAVLDAPELVRGKRVLDFACGCGLVAIAAARAGAQVRAVDIDPLAKVTTELNRAANGVELEIATTDLAGDPLREVDVVLAGDIWYEPAPSARFRRWFRRLSIPVLTADSGRPYAPRHVRELARYEVPTPFELEARTTRTARVLTFEAG